MSASQPPAKRGPRGYATIAEFRARPDLVQWIAGLQAMPEWQWLLSTFYSDISRLATGTNAERSLGQIEGLQRALVLLEYAGKPPKERAIDDEHGVSDIE